MCKSLSHKPKSYAIDYKDVLSLNNDLMEASSIQAPVLLHRECSQSWSTIPTVIPA